MSILPQTIMSQQMIFNCVSGQAGGRADFQLALDVFAVGFNCPFGNAQIAGDHFAGVATGQFDDDIIFPGGEN